MILSAIRADCRAIETSRSKKDDSVDRPISVLVADDDPRVTPDEARRWARHTTNSLAYHEFSGGHLFLTRHHEKVNGLISEQLLPRD